MVLCRSKELPYHSPLPVHLLRPGYVDQSYMCIIRTKRIYHNDWVMRCDYHRLSDTYASELELLGSIAPSKAVVCDALKWIHSRFGHVPSLSRHIPGRLVLECRLASIQVIDVDRPPRGKNVFRWKVDGEQCWVVRCGYMWYYCRPDKHLTVTSWEVDLCLFPSIATL